MSALQERVLACLRASSEAVLVWNVAAEVYGAQPPTRAQRVSIRRVLKSLEREGKVLVCSAAPTRARDEGRHLHAWIPGTHEQPKLHRRIRGDEVDALLIETLRSMGDDRFNHVHVRRGGAVVVAVRYSSVASAVNHKLEDRPGESRRASSWTALHTALRRAVDRLAAAGVVEVWIVRDRLFALRFRDGCLVKAKCHKATEGAAS